MKFLSIIKVGDFQTFSVLYYFCFESCLKSCLSSGLSSLFIIYTLFFSGIKIIKLYI